MTKKEFSKYFHELLLAEFKKHARSDLYDHHKNKAPKGLYKHPNLSNEKLKYIINGLVRRSIREKHYWPQPTEHTRRSFYSCWEGKDNRHRKQLAESQNHKCCYCGVVVQCDNYHLDNFQTIDHVVDLKHNGTNFWENLVIACKKCNRQRNHLRMDAYEFYYFIKFLIDT